MTSFVAPASLISSHEGVYQRCTLSEPNQWGRKCEFLRRSVNIRIKPAVGSLVNSRSQRSRKRTVVQNLDVSSSPGSRLPAKLAILVSGGGRSLENICERLEERTLTGCEISVVIASKSSAGAIQRAERYGIPTRVITMKEFDKNIETFSQAVTDVLDEFTIELVVLAGWMHFYSIPSGYHGKVINIHPSLIPAFCGKGYYGHHVHKAVIDFGAKITGCTVHLADNKYDHGPIILQKSVPVFDTDTPDELAARVFDEEREALPEAIQLFVDGRLSISERVIRIKPEVTSAETTAEIA